MDDDKPTNTPPDPSVISSDLHTQWQDHFHMRDQTWKVLQYSIYFFVGVIALQFKVEEKAVLIPIYVALLAISLLGVIIAMHHRRRQKEKFRIITAYQSKLGLYDEIIKPVLEDAHKTFVGRINTSTYIIAMQAALAIVAVALLIRVVCL